MDPNVRFVVFGTPVFVNWSLLFLGATIAYLPAKHGGGSAIVNYLAVFSCLVALLVLHELGHAVVAKAFSLKVHAIVLSGYGGCCVSDPPTRPWHAASSKLNSSEVICATQSLLKKQRENYSAYVPDLPGCVATGATISEVESEIRDAIAFHVEGLREDGLPIPAGDSQVEYVEVVA